MKNQSICVRVTCPLGLKQCAHQWVHHVLSSSGCQYEWCQGECKPVSELTESDKLVLALRQI